MRGRRRMLSKRLNQLHRRFERWMYANRLSLPDFLGIGAQKCGTTWLYENLLVHPELYLPDYKEIEYFDKNFDKSLRWYGALFATAGKKKKGEISPSYCYLSKEQILFLRTLMPEIRLILILRNPVERSWSHAMHRIVTSTGRQLEEIEDLEFYTLFEKKSFQKQGDYPTMLENWLEVFPREQLFVGLFEDIVHYPQRLLRQVFAHIGVSAEVDWSAFPFQDVIVPPTGPDIATHDFGRGVRLATHRRTDTFMPARYRRFLTDLYQSDIKVLSDRYELPVEQWLEG